MLDRTQTFAIGLEHIVLHSEGWVGSSIRGLSWEKLISHYNSDFIGFSSFCSSLFENLCCFAIW